MHVGKEEQSRVAGNAARQWVVPEALHEIWKVYTHGEEKL